MKKVVSWMLMACLLCTILAQGALPVNAMPSASEQMKIAQMNTLLLGVTGDMLNYGEVSNWSDEQINRMLSNKMNWDGYFGESWLDAMGIPKDMYQDGYIHVEYELVDDLCFDVFGRSYTPVELPYMLKVSGNEILFGQAAGEHTIAYVQDYIQQGSYYIAVGCVAWFGGAGSGVEDYFRAVFQSNHNSEFGMTLYSLEKISGNQSFKNVTAEASSVLSGGDYKAANVLDGNMSTAWVEGSGNVGAGEFITLNGSDMDLCAIEVDPGYHKSSDVLNKNGWPTKIRIETDDGVFMEEYCYSTETQVFLMELPSEARWLRITIVEAQAGSKYTDTCISEVRLFGIDTDAYFNGLSLDLPEDAPAPEDPVPAETAALPVEDAPVVTEETSVPEESAPVEDEETDAEEDMTEEREDDREIIVLDIMEKLDIANFLEDNALPVILIGAGLVVVLAGGVVLSILMKKKK